MTGTWTQHLKQCSREYQAQKQKAKKPRAPVHHRITGKQAHLEPTKRKRRKNDID